jgi:hypothetical protein
LQSIDSEELLDEPSLMAAPSKFAGSAYSIFSEICRRRQDEYMRHGSTSSTSDDDDSELLKSMHCHHRLGRPQLMRPHTVSGMLE